MKLEERILKRWHEWWTDKANPPVDRLLLQLIDIALEEVQRGMCEPRFTVQEAIAVEHALGMLEDLLGKNNSISAMEKLVFLRSVINPSTRSALEKLQAELDNIKQAQAVALNEINQDAIGETQQ